MWPKFHFTPIGENSRAKRELYPYFKALEEICAMTKFRPDLIQINVLTEGYSNFA